MTAAQRAEIAAAAAQRSWNSPDWTGVVRRSGLPAAVKLTALSLADMADREGHTAPGERNLAAVVGLSRSAVWGHLRQLQAAGLIEQTERAAPNRAAAYVLAYPAGICRRCLLAHETGYKCHRVVAV